MARSIRGALLIFLLALAVTAGVTAWAIADRKGPGTPQQSVR